MVAKTEPPADPPADSGPTTAELAARMDKTESTLDTILGLLKGKEGAAQQGAQGARTAELDAPTDVAQQIRNQLDERDRKARADAESNDLADWRKRTDDALAGLTEKQPETPVRTIERIMGWR
jgi:hypothetical protein